MPILTQGQKVDKFTVQSLIKENIYTETYRVEDSDHNPYFLKVFLLKKMPEKLLNSQSGNVFEIEYSQSLKHKNIISFIQSGVIDLEEGKAQYYITNYFSGELLADKIQREGALDENTALNIYKSIIFGLQYLHQASLFHNDINPSNIMLSSTSGIEPQIIDLGHISPRCSGRVSFDVNDLDSMFCASETFSGIFDEQSDIFAATAVLFTMLTGHAPWSEVEIPASASRSRRSLILKEFRRSNPIDFEALGLSPLATTILASGLAIDSNNRISSVSRIINLLDNSSSCETTHSITKPRKSDSSKRESTPPPSNSDPQDPANVEFVVKRGGGNGFADIAGMNDLKEYLSQKIIFVIKNKDLAEKYRLTPPNAMLLYGPPGCGKTFIAEKFAEETNFNYILIKSSDLASSFVHGSQQKIAKLFQQAEENAPVVLCFDEFDAFVPDRSLSATQNVASEVNEFLSQLNNCAKRGIFVVATTNRPDKIDPAVLRTGRIDKQVFVPLPDKAARREMFLLHLKGRPFEEEKILSEKLADMTEGYIASDIAFIVNDAAMVAAFTGQQITEELLETSIMNTHPSLRTDVLKQYDEIRHLMEGVERSAMLRTKVGFSF